jgi:deoxyadenosine/deoxycytidine kinase
MSKIVIDGNIGAGKTTQINRLQEMLYNVKKEPIHLWPLELFYSDPKRWAFLFQMMILKTLTPDTKSCIYERCPLSSLEVFWQILDKHPEEDKAYRAYYRDYGWSPDIYIYIDTPPDECMKRINSRTQDGDSGVSIDYLKTLDQKYTEMYTNMNCKKYILDGTQCEKRIHQNILNIINEVL